MNCAEADCAYVHMPAARRKSFTDEFDIIDANNDNQITKEELIDVLRRRLPDASEAEAQRWAAGVMRMADRNHDGALSRDEVRSRLSA